MIGVYLIQNKSNGKCYVGSAKNYFARIENHKKILNLGEHVNKKMQEDWDNGDIFLMKSLIELNSDKELESWENYFIGKYDALKCGYNSVLARRKINLTVIEDKKEVIEHFCNIEDLEKHLNLDKDEIAELEKMGMPRFLILGKHKRYLLSEVNKWINQMYNLSYPEELERITGLKYKEEK